MRLSLADCPICGRSVFLGLALGLADGETCVRCLRCRATPLTKGVIDDKCDSHDHQQASLRVVFLPRRRKNAMNLRIREVANGDLPSIERWLHANHVRATWGDPAQNLRLLGASPATGNGRAIIEADGREVGLVLWQHPAREELDVAGLTDIPTSAIDIDIMIGEPDALGRGLGAGAIGLVVAKALSDPTVPFVMACARLDNLASQRAFAKSGFHQDREFDDVPFGPHVLMLRHRQHAEEA